MRPAGWALARCCLAGTATFVAVLAGYQIPYEYSIDIGRVTDAPFVEAFHDREEAQGHPFRWSKGRSSLIVPGIGRNEGYNLILRMSSGPRPQGLPPPILTVTANGLDAGSFAVEAPPGKYTIPLSREVLDQPGNLRIDLRVSTFEAWGRDLGVVLEKVRLRPHAPRPPWPVLPPLGPSICWTACGCLWWALLRQTRFARRSKMLVAALLVLQVLLVLGLTFAREWSALLARSMVLASAVGYALAHQAPRWARQGRGRQALRLEFVYTLGISDPTVRRIVEAALLVLVASHFATTVLLPSAAGRSKDFRVYYAAGALWLEGGDYYDSKSLQAFRSSPTDSEIVNFTNPPSAAALYAPLALLPFPQARYVWIRLNFALLGVTGVLLWLGIRRSSTPPSILLLVLVLSTSEPLRITLVLGQVGVVILFLLSLCFWASSRRGANIAGCAVAVATALKIIPAFLLLYWLWKRDWRPLLAALLWGVLLLGLLMVAGGTDAWLVFFGRVLRAVSVPLAYFGNQSVQGFLLRLGHAHPEVPPAFNHSWELPAQTNGTLILLAPLFGLAATGFVARWLSRHGRRDLLGSQLEFAATIPLMLLAAPLVWEHYLMWLTLPFLVALCALGALRLTASAQIGTVILLCVSWLLVQYDRTDIYRIPGWPVALMSLGLYANVLLLVALLRLVKAGAPQEARLSR